MFYCTKGKTDLESNTLITYIPSGEYISILLYLHIYQYSSNQFFVVLSILFIVVFRLQRVKHLNIILCTYNTHAFEHTHTNRNNSIILYYIVMDVYKYPHQNVDGCFNGGFRRILWSKTQFILHLNIIKYFDFENQYLIIRMTWYLISLTVQMQIIISLAPT